MDSERPLVVVCRRDWTPLGFCGFGKTKPHLQSSVTRGGGGHKGLAKVAWAGSNERLVVAALEVRPSPCPVANSLWCTHRLIVRLYTCEVLPSTSTIGSKAVHEQRGGGLSCREARKH